MLAVALASELLYVLAANAFFMLGGVPKMFESTNSIDAHFRGAYTFWPGQIHVSKLRVIFQDHNVQWSLDLESADLKVRFRDLFARTFHASRVRGEGAVFRVRHRVDPWEKDRPPVAALAPIPEYVTPAVFEARAPEPAIPESEYNLWTVHLEDVDIGVQELWIQQFRYLGAGRARGAFRLRPARTLWVGPASLDLYAGRLLAGDHDLVGELRGRIECRIDPFEVKRPEGREVLRHISSDLHLRGRGVRLETAELFLDPWTRVNVISRPGALALDAIITRGRIDESSRLALNNEELTLLHPNFTLHFKQPSLTMRGTELGTGELVFGFARANLQRDGPPAAAPWSGPLSLSLVSSSIDTAAPAWALSDARAHAPDLHVPDLGWFNPLLHGAGPRFEGGSLAGAMLAHFADNRWQASSRIRVDRARARFGEAWLETSLSAAADLTAERTFWPRLNGTVHVDLNHALAGTGLQGLALSAHGGQLDAKLRSDGRDERELDVLSRLPELTARLGAKSAVAKNFAASAHFVQQANGAIDGQLRTSARDLSAQLGELTLRARPDLRLVAHAYDPERRSGRLVSELRIENLALSDVGPEQHCPIGTSPLVTVRAEHELLGDEGVRTRVSAELRDTKLSWGDFQARASALVRAELVQAGSGAREDASERRIAFAADARDVRLSSGGPAPRGWEARIPALSISGRLRGEQDLRGPLGLALDSARGRIGSIPVTTGVKARFEIERLDLERKEARGSGHLQLQDASLRASGFDVEKWWADVTLQSVVVSARENLDLNAAFRARMRDGTPGLAVMASEGELPRWVVGMFPLRELEASGFVFRRCHLTELRVIDGSGGPFLARGSLRSTPDETTGAFLLRLDAFAPLSAGLELAPSGGGVHLLAGDAWLAERIGALDQRAREMLDAPCVSTPRKCP